MTVFHVVGQSVGLTETVPVDGRSVGSFKTGAGNGSGDLTATGRAVSKYVGPLETGPVSSVHGPFSTGVVADVPPRT